jgi:hypothetical protein
MLLNDHQLYQIREIIQNYHEAFIVSAIGPEAVAGEILEKLKKLGLVNPQVNFVEDAYLYGQLLATLENPQVARMSYPEFKAYLSKNPIPLSAAEKHAVSMARHQGAQYVRGLGNRVDVQTGNVLIEADHQLRQRLESDIREKVSENIAKRETIKKLKSDLGWKTRDWARDWDRIAITEKQTATLNGQADHYRKRHGSGAQVAKRSMPDACPRCKALYNSPDGYPRIFRLEDLQANATNVGRKVNDWLPTVGPIHPNCQCVLVRIPDGWGYNEEGELVPGGEFGKSYASSSELRLALLQENDLQKSYQIVGKVNFQGLPITIETPVGGTRKWRTADGEAGETVMQAAYGFIERTEGADGDGIDVFLGPWPDAPKAFVIHQQNPKSGLYDEDKVFLGFTSKEAAETCYSIHYTDPESFFVTTSEMDMEQFKRWAQATKPISDGMLKKHEGPRLIIPLEKSAQNGGVQVSTEIGGATGMAVARNPGPGTMVNYLLGDAERHTAVPSRAVPEAIALTTPRAEQEVKRNRKSIKRDKRVYLYKEPLPVVPRKLEGADTLEAQSKEARKGSEERHQRLVDNYLRNVGRPKNKPISSEPEDEEKPKEEDEEESQEKGVIH